MSESLKFTFKLIRKRPIRALLTLLQIGLGVWVIVLVLSMNLQSTGVLDGLGSFAKIYIAKETEIVQSKIPLLFTANPKFSFDDLAVLQESEYIEDAFLHSTSRWWYNSMVINGSIYQIARGARSSSGYANVANLRLVEGHFFTKLDQEQKNRVMLISETIKDRVFPNESALGQTIILKSEWNNLDHEYEIIGVYKQQPTPLNHWIANSKFIIPLENQKRSDETWFYTEIFIKTKPDQLYEAAADAQTLLAHRAGEGMEIRVAYFKDYDDTFRSLIESTNFFLGFLVFISVLVSGIGILSILLVSVVERTKEIGLRRSLGATKLSIIGWVLNEALIFVLFGSVFGLGAAYFTAQPLSGLLAQGLSLDAFGEIWGLHPKAAIISVALALGSGFLFGFYPALIAANMSIVEALRDH